MEFKELAQDIMSQDRPASMNGWAGISGMGKLPGGKEVLAYARSLFGYIVICKDGHGKPYGFSLINSQRKYGEWKVERYEELSHALDAMESDYVDIEVVDEEEYSDALEYYEQLRPLICKGYILKERSIWNKTKTGSKEPYKEFFALRRYANGKLYCLINQWNRPEQEFARIFVKYMEDDSFTLTEGELTDDVRKRLQRIALFKEV